MERTPDSRCYICKYKDENCTYNGRCFELIRDPRVYILMGLPGSGKSTWSKKMASLSPNTIILSRDDLRFMLKGAYIYDKEYEPIVHELIVPMIRSTLKMGFDLIIDEVHLRARYRLELLDLLKSVRPTINYLVIFPEDKNNLHRRMSGDNRGYTAEQWDVIINKMKGYRDPIVPEEKYDLTKTIDDINSESAYSF